MRKDKKYVPEEATDTPATATPAPTPGAPGRVIAIVGRPNVGKSALFNRLVGKRIAIVHEEAGVTRDRLVHEVIRDGEHFELIDTGGLDTFDRQQPDHEIKAGKIAIEDAVALIWVVDITAGCAPLDEEVGTLLRRSGKPVFLAVNKADTPRLDDKTAEFEKFNYPIYPVSALHARGIGELTSAAMVHLPPGAPPETTEALKVVVAGRPNVGKSSFINKLLGHNRVIVSTVPGTTRDSIVVPFVIGEGAQARRYQLIDTPGIRRSGRLHEAVEKFSLIRSEESIKLADVVVLMLDAEDGPTAIDKRIAALIQEAQKGCLIIVNKWDLVPEGVKMATYEKALQAALPYLAFPMLFVSSLDGTNLRKSIEAIDRVAAAVQFKMPTGVMNRVLRDAMQKVQPPMIEGRRLKLYYATQVGTKPVRIKLFVNQTRRLTPAYETYLIRALRRTFDLDGAPVIFHLASSHNPLTPGGSAKT
ncbi:MAG: ribosome biogenesis GTPase Der [Kiritimatiellaeota bacterium]|nr:ribosome biogenesis GTPase Der [Kiritimatiellota bacterium]